MHYGLGEEDEFVLASYTFPQIITDATWTREVEKLLRSETFFLDAREFQHFRHRKKKSRAFKHTVINTR